MTSVKHQTMIAATPEQIWELISDPDTHPQWWPYVIRVEGLGELRTEAKYRQVTRSFGPIKIETQFQIEQLDDLHEVCFRCLDTGVFARWVLTPAQGGTFAEIEMGMEPASARVRIVNATVGGILLERWAADAVRGLRDQFGE